MRRPLIVANWKMHKRLDDALHDAVAIKNQVSAVSKCDVAIAPVNVHLKAVADRLEGSGLMVAGQNCAVTNFDGAHTGEVSAEMLRNVGCRLVIVGHSERRTLYGDSDKSINQRVKAAVTAGLAAILCVGESIEERSAGHHLDVVDRQLLIGLNGLTLADAARIIIAYEPVWAIGTGVTATPEQAQEMHGHIRGKLAEMFGNGAAEQIRLIYGGSVKPENISELMSKSDIDGALVGGASLDPSSFASIVNF